MLCRILDAASNNLPPYQVIITDCTEKCHFFLHFSQTGRGEPPRREKCVQFCNTKCLPAEISAAICRKGQIAPMMWEGDFHRLLPPAGAFAHFSGWWEKWAVGDTFLVQKGLLAKSMPPAAIGEKTAGKNSRPAAERGSDPLESKGKRTPACASALDAAILLERQKLCIAVKSPEVHQNSALPTVRGCSSTSRILLTPVRYITIRSKPRPKPACLQEP